MKSYKTIKKQLFRNKRVRETYAKLGPEFKLAEMIISKRIEQGLTQADLAKRIGTKQPAIARLESGNYNPSIIFLKKTASALGAALEVSIV